MANADNGVNDVKRVNPPFSPLNKKRFHERVLSDTDIHQKYSASNEKDKNQNLGMFDFENFNIPETMEEIDNQREMPSTGARSNLITDQMF